MAIESICIGTAPREDPLVIQTTIKILPIVDIHGRITHWRCSCCSGTTSVSPDFMGCFLLGLQ